MSMVVEKPLSIVIVYTLALGAVYAASYRGLTKHIKRLQPENDDEKKTLNSKEEGEKGIVATASEAESQPAKESKPKSKWEKWRVGLAAVGTVCVVWGIGLLLAFGLPKIATPRMLDVIWMLLVGHQIWMVYRELIANILPDPRNMDIRWSRWNAITWTQSATEYSGPAPQTTPRRVANGIFTLATLAGVYTGTEWVIAFPVAALVYVAVSSTWIPDRSVRSTLKWMLFIQVAVIAFTGLVMGGSWVYRLYYPIDPTKPKSTDPKPSQEVLLLMMMFSSSMPLVVSGHLIGLSLRFDYTRALRSNTISVPPVTSSTKFVKLPPYPKPFFKAAFSALCVILLNFGITQLTPNGTMNDAGLMIYAFCIPATIVGVRMIGVAAQEGVWEEFMGYTELGRKALKEQRKDVIAVERLTDVQEKRTSELDSVSRSDVAS